MINTLVLLAVAVVAALYTIARAFRPYFNCWGATKEEHHLRFPGEEFLADRTIASTHAITIRSQPSEIWPWLLQVGVGRGGFYSYSWLENLVGCRVRNVDKIIPELQTLKVGDYVILHPKAPPLKVTYLEADRALAMTGWMFLLKPINDGETRLISRTYVIQPDESGKLSARFSNFMMKSVFFEFAHFVMGRKQLKEIKRLVEGHVRRKNLDRLSFGLEGSREILTQSFARSKH